MLVIFDCNYLMFIAKHPLREQKLYFFMSVTHDTKNSAGANMNEYINRWITTVVWVYSWFPELSIPDSDEGVERETWTKK